MSGTSSYSDAGAIRFPFVPRCSASGRLLRLSRLPSALAYGWNAATDPGRLMTEHEHKRAAQYARACWALFLRLDARWVEGPDGGRYVAGHYGARFL